ncbi:MAG: protein kinase [Deltaproteobacteria bacterium]|nr:protein kinase [Deltaproteobacteria bacterium]
MDEAEVPSARTFGRYRLLEQFAEGGMGRVHLARKSGTSELCVLKLLQERFEETEEVGRRFRREAHLVSFLDDPHIARVLDAGSHDGAFYIAFELIEGHSLAQLLSRLSRANRWLPPAAAVRIVVEALDGLAHAHERTDPEGQPLGLVHRDLSPANLMLSYQGEVKIIDFGIATAQVDDFRTTPGRFLGTVRYMSPEQVLLQPVDRRSDLYTIGAVLWEMLARRRLISKMPVHEMMEAIARQAPVSLQVVAPHLPPGLVQVVEQSLAKEPEQRFQSARELRDALLDATVELERWDQAQLAQLISREFAEEHRSLEAKLDQLRSGVTHELDPEHHAETKVNPLPDDVLQARTLDTDWAEALAPRLEAAETEVIAPLAFNTRVIPLRDELPGKRLTPVITTRPSPTPRPKLQVTAPDPRREKRVSRVARWASAISLVLVTATVVVELNQRGQTPVAEPPPPTSTRAPNPEPPATPTPTPSPAPLPVVAETSEPSLATSPPPPVAERTPKAGSKNTPTRPAPKSSAPNAPPEEGPPREAPEPEVRRALRQALSHPEDGARLIEAHRALSRVAQKLPADRRLGAQLELDAALRAGDVHALAEAWERIQSNL